MPEPGVEGALGLADFVSALREELQEARRRAEQDPDDPLNLKVGPIELELQVAYTLERSGEASAGVKAKFWVLEFGEAGVKGTLSRQDVRTQHVKLTLTPRLERTVVDDTGTTRTEVIDVDVTGRTEATEARTVMPPAPPTPPVTP